MDAIGLMGLSAMIGSGGYSLIKTEYLDLVHDSQESLTVPAGALVCMASYTSVGGNGALIVYCATCRGGSVRATEDVDVSRFNMSWGSGSAVNISADMISGHLYVNIYWLG